MKERGLYSLNGEFRTDREIKRTLALKGELPVFETPFPVNRDWRYWSGRFQQRAEDYKEAVGLKESHVEIRLPENALVNFIGDLHAGNPWTFHDRIDQEIELILNTTNSFAVLGGDCVDGYFFNPAQMEQIEQAPQQYRYLRSLVHELGKQNKLLVAWGGDHDGWGKRMGYDPYVEFAENVGAHFMHGVGHITFKQGDEKIRVTGAHRLPGHSIYNKAHPSTRASKEVQGADIYANFHTHEKAHLEQGVNLFGGGARWVHACSAGPYMASSEYSRKLGFARQDPEVMFGWSFELVNGEITYHKDIVKAHKKFK